MRIANMPFHGTRLFKNKENFRYIRKVWEQLKQIYDVHQSTVTIKHFLPEKEGLEIKKKEIL